MPDLTRAGSSTYRTAVTASYGPDLPGLVPILELWVPAEELNELNTPSSGRPKVSTSSAGRAGA